MVVGCTDFFPVLTSNGLCHSFNGIETTQVYSQEMRETQIMQAFNAVFGTFETQSRKYRGTGHSEGKLNTEQNILI